MTLQPFAKLRGPAGPDALSRVQDNLDRTLSSLQTALAPKWVAVPLPLGNGWVPYTPTAGEAGSIHGFASGAWYLRDASGFVHLRGIINSGNTGPTASVFTLPVGYRPFFEEGFGFGGNVDIRVLDNGDVRVLSALNSYVWLSGISFLAEQ